MKWMHWLKLFAFRVLKFTNLNTTAPCFISKKFQNHCSLQHILAFKVIQPTSNKIRTHSNPGWSTKTKLRTLLNPSKKLKLQPETGQTQAQIRKKLNFEPFWTRFIYTKIELETHPKPHTHEPRWTQHYCVPIMYILMRKILPVKTK